MGNENRYGGKAFTVGHETEKRIAPQTAKSAGSRWSCDKEMQYDTRKYPHLFPLRQSPHCPSQRRMQLLPQAEGEQALPPLRPAHDTGQRRHLFHLPGCAQRPSGLCADGRAGGPADRAAAVGSPAASQRPLLRPDLRNDWNPPLHSLLDGHAGAGYETDRLRTG